MASPSVKPMACVNCGHTELEHGQTGTRPCLATVGQDRSFCPCDEFRPAKLNKAA